MEVKKISAIVFVCVVLIALGVTIGVLVHKNNKADKCAALISKMPISDHKLQKSFKERDDILSAYYNSWCGILNGDNFGNNLGMMSGFLRKQLRNSLAIRKSDAGELISDARDCEFDKKRIAIYEEIYDYSTPTKVINKRSKDNCDQLISAMKEARVKQEFYGNNTISSSTIASNN